MLDVGARRAQLRRVPPSAPLTRRAVPVRSRRLTLALALLPTLALLSACARTVPVDGVSPDSAAADVPAQRFDADVPLEVENHHWLDVNVYLVLRGNRTRLGTVTGSRTETLQIPRQHLSGYAGDLRFAAEPIGSREGLLSDYITLRPGDHVHWVLESQLNRSSIEVVR
jgi:hypothetical protein